MLERSLFDHYRLYPENILQAYQVTIIEANGERYMLTPVHSEQSQVQQQAEMANWLLSQGEDGIPELVPTDTGKATLDLDGTVMALYRLPSEAKMMRSYDPVGKRLATFHQRGQFYAHQGKRKAPSGAQSWKGRWEKRLDQMESWYVHIRNEQIKTPFDEDFLLTYPYYMGLSENAIQLLNDIAIDDGAASMEQGNTICHRRFQDSTWLTVDERFPSAVKVPGQLVYDHFSRDLSEWLRDDFKQSSGNERNRPLQFPEMLTTYDQERPLTVVDRKLVAARLLFPLHYFDTVEEYYQSVDERKKGELASEFRTAIYDSGSYEKNVNNVLHYMIDERTRMRLPGWLG
ncbi:spore coat putative kinase YutH [Alteribacter keqinensis]|uniref:Spore coat protein YutH n=1 Tax=Alteribacter keqinensis TaxID=2483800 RepID=A0A3M7TQ70_9BACI|nr:spore coat protein YutH [Alteribacter keqinensis]RNA67407.1 spore coat protein YutH [Alteribacter keqinensis]